MSNTLTSKINSIACLISTLFDLTSTANVYKFLADLKFSVFFCKNWIFNNLIEIHYLTIPSKYLTSAADNTNTSAASKLSTDKLVILVTCTFGKFLTDK